MDPALSISSPFHNAMEGKEGVFDGAINSIINPVLSHGLPSDEQGRTRYPYSNTEMNQGYGAPTSLSFMSPDTLAQNIHSPSLGNFTNPYSIPRSTGSNSGGNGHAGSSSHHHTSSKMDVKGGNTTKSHKKSSSQFRLKGHRVPVPCAVCDQTMTFSRVPDDGIYMCSSCFLRSKERERPPRSYPTLTFKCCPTATTELEGGVVRCAGCGGWYHQRCVGITSDQPLLAEYVTLSNTKWYCPEESCSAMVLAKHVKHLMK